MADLLRMPEVAANTAAAVLSTWSVPEGAAFAARDVLAVIETEKAVVELEAETDGTLLRHLVAEGAEVGVGTPIALLAAAGEAVTDVDAALSALGAADAGGQARPAEPAATAEPAAPATDRPPVATVVDGAAGRRFSSPLARRLARERGLDLAAVVGTGPGGRIVRRDVLAADVPAPAATSAAAAATRDDRAAPVGATDLPHSRLRRAVAARLTESKTTAPHFYLRGTADVADLLRLREQVNDGAAVRVSVNDLLVKAVGKAHLLVPALNVVWTPDAVRSFATVDVSVAIATDRGLVTPVVRSVERLTVTEVASRLRDLAERARAGRLQQHELEGGTISLSNLGMYGTEEFAAIINPPQAAVLAVGAVRQAAVVRDGQVVAGTVMTVTLSVDHRPVDGVHAAEWMQAFLGLLERPAQILS